MIWKMMRLDEAAYDKLLQRRKKDPKLKTGKAALDAEHDLSIPVTPCPTKGPSKSKYKSRACGGYASVKEARRAAELKLLEKAGKIRNLREQVQYELIPAQVGLGFTERACTYFADFVYEELYSPVINGYELTPWWSQVVEDVKGYKKGAAYAVFVIKRKLMLQVHKIRVREI